MSARCHSQCNIKLGLSPISHYYILHLCIFALRISHLRTLRCCNVKSQFILNLNSAIYAKIVPSLAPKLLYIFVCFWRMHPVVWFVTFVKQHLFEILVQISIAKIIFLELSPRSHQHLTIALKSIVF
jgi:hypothetical protein